MSDLPACWCGGREFRRRLAGAGETPRGERYPFAIEVCRACGTGQTVPVPAAVTYTATDTDLNDRVRQLELWRRFARESLVVVRRFTTGGTLLDVGCNIGVLVDEARQAGFTATGLDPDRNAVEYGRMQFGADLRVGTIGAAELGRFNVILLEQTLEHLAAPRDFLATLRPHLADGGIVVVSVPNYTGLFPRLTGAAWYGWWPWEHRWHFSPAALRRLAAAGGWAVRGEHRCRLHHPHGWRSRREVKETALDLLGALPGQGDKIYSVLA